MPLHQFLVYVFDNALLTRNLSRTDKSTSHLPLPGKPTDTYFPADEP